MEIEEAIFFQCETEKFLLLNYQKETCKQSEMHDNSAVCMFRSKNDQKSGDKMEAQRRP